MSLTHYFLNDYPSTFDRFFDEAFNSRALRQPSQQVEAFRPRMDVHHDDKSNAVTVSFELPGMQKEDVAIDVHNNVLTVSGETKHSSERNEDGYAIRERRFGKFSRSLSLPQGLKNEDIKASMTNGVLTIAFPRSAPEAAPARISIA
ncbi:small heat shock protein [Gloeopeniophorella convolvens]|nr:small heat shock protein [Gloeopeniophorella convolvens]